MFGRMISCLLELFSKLKLAKSFSYCHHIDQKTQGAKHGSYQSSVVGTHGVK